MNILILPAIALRSMTVLPDMVIHFDISRESSIKALEKALSADDQRIFLTAQTDPEIGDPTPDDLYKTGTVAVITQVFKLPNNVFRVQVEGKKKAIAQYIGDTEAGLAANVEVCDTWIKPADDYTSKAMISGLREVIRKISIANPNLGKDMLKKWMDIDKADVLIKRMIIDYPMLNQNKQHFLELDSIEECYEDLVRYILEELNIYQIKDELTQKVKERVDKNQKDYIIREQLKVLNDELNGSSDVSEADDYINQLEKLNASSEIKESIRKEIKRFRAVTQGSSEANVERGYIETLLSLPWDNCSQDNKDIDNARTVLDRDHYGMKEIKERILETLAVRNVTEACNAPVICLVGPPGTGKTSIARSVADALNRQYVRVCLGGVRDEAEIRGHRKTYVGAMPGRIIDGIKKAGVKNPVMVLDEIDKVSNDYRSDTSAALLEVLDTEQNSRFIDHYVELPTDLSQILFIATANDLSGVSKPLLDRMEIIEVNSYTKNEKMHIAKEHLVAKQIKKNGLTRADIKFTDRALSDIIDCYTREAGVRNLERQIAKVCRKVVVSQYHDGKIDHGAVTVSITGKNLSDYLGKKKYHPDKVNKHDEAGIVRGLAWTSAGGDTLEIEVNTMPGKDSLILTGQMGDVMKESARIALTYVQSVVSKAPYRVSQKFFDDNVVHIHIPEGAVPKDGPSAGVTMSTAILSAVTGIPVRSDVAMTGEVTLRGRVLPIGGLKEKLLAAKTAGVKTVIVPEENRPDVEEFDEEITGGLSVVYARDMKQVLACALVSK